MALEKECMRYVLPRPSITPYFNGTAVDYEDQRQRLAQRWLQPQPKYQRKNGYIIHILSMRFEHPPDSFL